MFNSFQHHPVGARIPESIHAVSCSLPNMAAVIGYEEKDPQIMRYLDSGYPRFLQHPYINQVLAEFQPEFEQRHLFAVVSEQILKFASEYLDIQGKQNDIAGFPVGNFYILHTSAENQAIISKFLQHTGGSISSRLAEDYLFSKGMVRQIQVESGFSSNAHSSSAKSVVQDILAKKHNASHISDIYLGNSGMSCFYAAFRALHDIQQINGKTIWIQFGWLYLDTIELMRKYARNENEYVHFSDVFDLNNLKQFIKQNSNKIAGIITEAPTNPLIQTMDVAALYDLSRQHNIALVLDPTIASPHNIHCLQYSDVVVNSLTKYAASAGDIMMGSLAINQNSSWYSLLKQKIPEYLILPYKRDLDRMALEIQNYDSVITTMNQNHTALLEMLEKHAGIGQIHHALSPASIQNFKKIKKAGGGSGSMMSIELNGKLDRFYDKIKIAKGPSFGMQSSMICPFIYLAHYDMIQSASGRKKLKANDLNPELIRISVGTEDSDQICATFHEALSQL